MLLALLCLAVAAQPQAEKGLLGRELAEVIKNEFFTTHKLAEVRRRSSGEINQVVFQPAGPNRDQIRVFVRTNGEGETRTIDVVLHRSFVDGSTGAAARELVRSLLLAAVPRGDDPGIDALVKELAGGPLDRGSPAYEVVAGRQPEFATPGKQVRVSLTNIGQGPSRVLRISLNRGAAARD